MKWRFPPVIRVVNGIGGALRLTGEANVKREEEFEREGERDKEIYVYSMKIPQFHPFHFISLSHAPSDQVKSRGALPTFILFVFRPQIEAPPPPAP